MKWTEMPRADGRMEFQCEHGVGHGNGVHGCCHEGCCGRDDFPLKNIKLEVYWVEDAIRGTIYMKDAVGNVIVNCTKCGEAWIRPEVVNIWRDTYCPSCWEKRNAAIR